MSRAPIKNSTRVSSVLTIAAVLLIAAFSTATFSEAVTFGQPSSSAPLDDALVIRPGLRPRIPDNGRKVTANPSAPSAPLANLYVEFGGTCGGNIPCFNTIQAAVNAANPGDTINVYAGTYVEQINVNKALTLLGPNAGINPNTGSRVAEAVIIPTASDPLNPGFAGPIVVTFSAPGVTFDGFTVDGDNPSLTSGVVFNGSDVDAEFGIYGDGSANLDAVITNNITKNIGEIAIWLNTFGIGGARNANSRMTANKVDNVLGAFGQALRISDDAWVDVIDNVVTRSRLGITIENYSGNVTTHPSSLIANNNVTTFRIGIRHNLHYVYSAPGFRILLNTVQSYVQSPMPPQVTTPTTYEGIRVESVQQTVPVTVGANTLTGNRTTLMGAGYTRVDGMDLVNASNTSPNIIFRFNVASDFIRGAFNDTPALPNFGCNRLTGNTTGVYLSSNATSGLIAHANDIAGNGFGMQNDGPATVNAQQNWWGAASGPGSVGPGSGDGVSINVDFTNWLASPSTCAGLAPTAGGGVVSGRIVDAGGSPVEGAVVLLTGAQNRKFITDANGFYRFENVETGAFYVVTPTRANYTFSPAAFSFSQIGETTNAAFSATANGGTLNPLDTPEYFVRQHYVDFLGREPDEAGFNFWSDQILACGTDTECVDRKRMHVSAAYFLSIEFQETGGFVDGLFRASFARRPTYSEFKPDAATVGLGVQIGKPGWDTMLATNKAAFLEAFMQRAAFRAAFDSMSNAAYVDALTTNTGVAFSEADRGSIISGLEGGTMTRAAALRVVVENATFVNAKRNQAFVMMEYFGYLRREPDAEGYDFWLNKLNEFNGNFEQAEMVRAFILSTEYRQRFPR